MELAIAADGGEGFLLNGCWAKLDTLQDRGVKDINAGINTITNELHRLLNKTVDSRSMVWLMNNDTILRWLFDFCNYNCAFISVCLVEFCQFSKGVVANDIRVQDEERIVVSPQDLFGEFQRTCRS